jgi:hypothetical protein
MPSIYRRHPSFNRTDCFRRDPRGRPQVVRLVKTLGMVWATEDFGEHPEVTGSV